MVEGSTQPFHSVEGDRILKLEDVLVERDFQTDKSGRTSVHVRVKATASPIDEDYVSITADIDFTLSDGDTTLGTCGCVGLVFGKDHPSRPVVADSDLHIPTDANVTALEAAVDLTKVVHAQGNARFERERPSED